MLKACVTSDGLFSDFLNSNFGLLIIQAEVLLPITFHLYVNDIEINFLIFGCVPFEIASLNLFASINKLLSNMEITH